MQRQIYSRHCRHSIAQCNGTDDAPAHYFPHRLSCNVWKLGATRASCVQVSICTESSAETQCTEQPQEKSLYPLAHDCKTKLPKRFLLVKCLPLQTFLFCPFTFLSPIRRRLIALGLGVTQMWPHLHAPWGEAVGPQLDVDGRRIRRQMCLLFHIARAFFTHVTFSEPQVLASPCMHVTNYSSGAWVVVASKVVAFATEVVPTVVASTAALMRVLKATASAVVVLVAVARTHWPAGSEIGQVHLVVV